MSSRPDRPAPRLEPVPAPAAGADFVVVANRLPVDRDTSGDEPTWRTSPGGLVTGVAPVMRSREGAWIGWAGIADEEFEPFDLDSMHLVPVRLSSEEVVRYYEGFSNATLWPLFHDVIVPPEFHRTWWEAYQRVNERFARTAAQTAAAGATVWVHDYQLLLVPEMLRALRPDVSIGFFNHIPFPPWEIFSQLPWRREILAGALGADLIGFQRPADAANFRRAARIDRGWSTAGMDIRVPADPERGTAAHVSRAAAFPISIDAEELDAYSHDPQIIERAAQIRRDLGDPAVVILGVDRMDYTKGIRHRLKAYGELLDSGALSTDDVTLVQIATPSRERLDQYQQIRTEVELAVGRINGEHSGLGKQAVHYFHHSFPRAEMTAFYLAADVMLVTALRDGMNLVAKEYVACRTGDDGALVLSEFAGAADQLTQALMVNPHDIAGLKRAIRRAVEMPKAAQHRRMQAMRRRLAKENVQAWSQAFLDELEELDEDKGGQATPAAATPAAATADAGPGGADSAAVGPASTEPGRSAAPAPAPEEGTA
ncbi:trehalose-6-phosphate synthase [Brevibacterium sp. 5221]|uniref:Trehalose-6-phosphate synthase n=1 Tax=Brevibacterium rongguiense TaxID=2695267 RepID=A0A6N9H9D4_9MICO|nr:MULTISPECIES: trehalose-6-phosphate synthase [Brevibacterium]MYM20657.1 trehalose-6-phosphate synthase [Brevibacterium rongguiense]WAL40022.1 trehalose-6-phosphate synthase [Brevibacterium sp. BRM-1]